MKTPLPLDTNDVSWQVGDKALRTFHGDLAYGPITGNIQEIQRQVNLLKNHNGNGIRNIQTVENSKGKMT